MYDDSEDEIVCEDYFDDQFDEANYRREREEDREYAIRSEALTHSMSMNGFGFGVGAGDPRTADDVVADAEKFATFLRGKAA